MAKLSVFWPVKPYRINQAFGIFNPAYKQFNFTHHNGIDMATYDGQPAYAMCDSYVVNVGENSSAGKFARIRTIEPVDAEGRIGLVGFTYMHGKEIKVVKGQMLKAGDLVMLCDNTGFSTGHHLHVSAFFISPSGEKQRIGRKESDYCFDFTPYWNKYYAEDAQKVFALYYQVLSLLRTWLNRM